MTEKRSGLYFLAPVIGVLALSSACTIYKSSDRDAFNSSALAGAPRRTSLLFSKSDCAKLNTDSRALPKEWNANGEAVLIDVPALAFFKSSSESTSGPLPSVLVCDFMLSEAALAEPMSEVIDAARSVTESWSLLGGETSRRPSANDK